VIDEDEPQRQSAARIQPQVAAISLRPKGWTFSRRRQTIGHDLINPTHRFRTTLATLCQ
jgi:hypothetical protein